MWPPPEGRRERTPRPRVVLDASVLLGPSRSVVVAGAALRYYDVYWSSWLIGEFVRKRTEWIANRALKEGCTPAELRRRQRASRERVDAAVAEMSRVFRLVDYTAAPTAALDWLARRKGPRRGIRFDVVAVTDGPRGPTLQHFENAFDAGP